MEDIVALLIPITFLIVVGLIFKWLSDNRVRRELTAADATPEFAEKVLTTPPQNIDSSLKWGMVSVAVGLSLFAVQIFDLDENDPITFGLVFVFGGAALLAFYALKSRD